jgi:hypothetical protein
VLGSNIKLPFAKASKKSRLSLARRGFGVRRITDRNQRFGLACHPWLPPNVGRRQLLWRALARLHGGVERDLGPGILAAFLSETRHRNQPRRSSLMKRLAKCLSGAFASVSASLPPLGTLALLRQGFFSIPV